MSNGLQRAFLWTVAMAASVVALAMPLHAQGLVGSIVPPYPAGLSEQEGSCVGDKPGQPCEWGIGILANAAGKKVQIYAGSDATDGRKDARWRVTDVLPYPTLGKGLDLAVAVCRSGGAEDSAILAVVRNAKREFLQATGWVYRLDRTSGKFVKLSPTGIDCINAGLDAD
jgi:hypothetical protein